VINATNAGDLVKLGGIQLPGAASDLLPAISDGGSIYVDIGTPVGLPVVDGGRVVVGTRSGRIVAPGPPRLIRRQPGRLRSSPRSRMLLSMRAKRSGGTPARQNSDDLA